MRRTLIFFGVFLLSLHFISAQVAPSKFFIGFTDKDNTPYTLSNPSAFLTQRAIDRRTSQSCVFDDKDLPVDPFYVDSILNAGNVTLLTRSKWLNGVTIYTTDSLALVNINNMSFVQNVVAVARTSAPNKSSKLDVPLHPLKPENYNVRPENLKKLTSAYDYGFSANQIEMIGLDFLHDQGFSGDGIMIAVLDAGFFSVDTLPVFDSLWSHNRVLGTRDFVSPGSNVYNSHTHGMMVLSLMAGNVPGQLIGTAPQASFWLLRSEDGPTEYLVEEYNWVSAAEFADSIGADVINSSLGYTEFDDSTQNHVYADLDGNTCVVTRGADIAASRGILMVNSAGNSAQTSWQRIIAPSDADSVFTIGAVDENEIYASFSSVGYSADGRVKPDVVAQGANTVVASTQGGIMTGNGTSFSSPIMAGAMACLKQANPNATNMQLIEAVRQSASQYLTPDSLLGYGIPNFAAAHLLLAGVSIQNTEYKIDLDIFPNPFTDNLSILYFSTDTHMLTIEVFDFSGRLVSSPIGLQAHKGYNSYQISSLDMLTKGIYYLRLTHQNNVTVRKLVKIS